MYLSPGHDVNWSIMHMQLEILNFGVWRSMIGTLWLMNCTPAFQRYVNSKLVLHENWYCVLPLSSSA